MVKKFVTQPADLAAMTKLPSGVYYQTTIPGAGAGITDATPLSMLYGWHREVYDIWLQELREFTASADFMERAVVRDELHDLK